MWSSLAASCSFPSLSPLSSSPSLDLLESAFLYAPFVAVVVSFLDLLLVFVCAAFLLPVLPGGGFGALLILSSVPGLSPRLLRLGVFFLAVAACPGFAPFGLASASTWWSPSALSPSLVLPCFSWSLSAPPPASCRQCWRPPSRSQSSCGWSSCWPCLRYWCFMFKHSILDYSLLIDLFLDDSLLGGSVLYGPGVLLVLLSLWISCLSFSLRALS